MKKLLLTYLILFCGVIYSQNKISFTDINNADINLSGSFKSYKILQINENLNSFGNGEKLTLSYDRDYDFELHENRLLSNDYAALVKGENGVERKTLDELNFDGKYFINSDCSAKHQLALTLFKNQYSFYVKSNDREFYIDPLRKYNNAASVDEYVYYEVKDIIGNPMTACGVENSRDTGNFHPERSQAQQPNDVCKTLELNFCVDYSFYAFFGYSINSSINKTLEIMNLSQLDYTVANGLEYDVHFKLKRHYLITCTGCNYWPTTGNINTNHNSFIQYENFTQIFQTKADANVFWEYNVSDSYLGLSNLGGLTYCDPLWTLNTVGAATIRVANDISDIARSVLSHELGHNFNCNHIDGTNIMSATVSTSHYWNPNSVAIINNTLTTSACFSDCQAALCDNKKVENLTVTFDTTNSLVNINWLSEVGMQYKVRLYTFNTNTWTGYTTVSYPQNSLILPYTDTVLCGNKYKIEIVPVCSGINGFAQLVVANTTAPVAAYPGLSFTTPNIFYCSGYTYTISVSSPHPGTNPIYVWTVNGIVVGSNSPNYTTSTLQNNDQLICTITSNDPCLSNPTSSIIVSVTVRVLSGSNCTLSDTEFDLENVVYFPNPVENQFTVKSKSIIKSISIFNILGQKLFENNISTTESILDLSLFPKATYLVKIDFDRFTKTIKIVKK